MGILAGCLLFCGCQVFALRPPQSVEEEKVSEIILALSEKLDEDHWSFNSQWQVEKIVTHPEIVRKPRWNFQEDEAESLLSELEVRKTSSEPQTQTSADSDTEEEEMAAAQEGKPWSGFAPGELTDSASTQEFRKLVRAGGIVGWNAAILWGQRDPHTAGEAVPILKKLSSETLYYHPETGKEVRAPQVVRGQNREVVPKRPLNKLTNPVGTGEKEQNDKTAEEKNAPLLTFKNPNRKQKQSGPNKVSEKMQAAAMESLCRVLTAQEGDPLESLAPIGALLEKTTLPDLVRIEAYLGISRWAPPVNIPRLNTALRETGTRSTNLTKIRLAAYDACILHAYWNTYLQSDAEKRIKYRSELWPAAIHQAGQSRNSDVQQKYCLWLSLAQPPDALDILERYTHKQTPKTKETAFMALGYLNSGDAVNFLEEYAQSNSALDRIMAMKGLAIYGPQYLLPHIEDEEFKVRIEIVKLLSQQPSQASYEGLVRLIGDSNPQVSRAVTEDLEQWPDELVLPLLVEGMVESRYAATHQACLLQIQQRTGRDETLVLSARLEERRLQVANWARKQNLPLSRGGNIKLAAASFNPSRSRDIRREEMTRLLEKLTQSLERGENPDEIVSDELMTFSPQEAMLLEQELQQQSELVQHHLQRKVLPFIHPAYKAKEQLADPIVQLRRKAAHDLRNYATQLSLPDRIVQELRMLMVSEQDHEVWRDIMQAVMRDGTPQNAELARMALGNTWADIRLLGCQYFYQYAQPEYAEFLRPLLTDPDTRVQSLAIQVVGKSRNPALLRAASLQNQGDLNKTDRTAAGQQGLEELLQTTDERLRFEVLVAMMKLGDWRAMNELEVIGTHAEPAQREAVIVAIGESGQSRFQGTLLRLAEREPVPRLQQLILSKMEQLAPLGTQLPTNYDIYPYERKLAVWKGLFQEKTAFSATSVPVQPIR